MRFFRLTIRLTFSQNIVFRVKMLDGNFLTILHEKQIVRC